MVPSNSMIGRSRSLQASSTWSPTIAAIFSDDNPSDFAISAVLRAAATGLAAPILVTIFIPLAAQAGNTARIRSSSSGSYPLSGFFMRACCASATVRSPRHSNTRYWISPFSASSTAGSMRSPEYPAPDPILMVRIQSPPTQRQVPDGLVAAASCNDEYPSAGDRKHTSGPRTIVRVPEYAPCAGVAGPLTPDGQLSHQEHAGQAARSRGRK